MCVIIYYVMKIIAISDTHDNIWKLERLFDSLKHNKPHLLIHCGDWCAPFMLKKIAAFGVFVHGVFGNVDGDKALMMEIALKELKDLLLHSPFADIEFGGRKIAVVHHPFFAEAIFSKGVHDVVFYGHVHTPSIKKEGGRALICPGEIMGLKGRSTFCIYDTESGEAQILDVE